MGRTYADKLPEFKSEQDRQDWIISFYEGRLQYFLGNIGSITSYGVKITPNLIKTTWRRYSQLMENYHVTDWEQS